MPPDPPPGEGVQTRLAQAAGPDRTAAPPILSQVIHSAGDPLDPATREFMEPRFGHDFRRVRVHADARAGEAAASIGARAFTAGLHVVFGAGEYAPRSPSGRRLLAHELAHTLQRGPGIMRQAAEKAEEGGLTSPILAGISELQMAYLGELVIGEGAAGEFVTRIQRALLAEDAAALPEFGADGRYGKETKAAVIAFQRRHGLPVDGVVGPRTIRALDHARSGIAILQTPGGGSQAPSDTGLSLRQRFTTSTRDPLSPLLPLLPGVEKETTYFRREFPPAQTAYGTLHRTLSLVGAASLSPVGGPVTLSEGAMSLEFEKFATSLSYKLGESLDDISFDSMNASLGGGKADVSYEPPSTWKISYGLPKEVVLGRARLSGRLKTVLELTLVPRSPPNAPVPVKQPDWQPFPAADPLEVLKRTQPAVYVGGALLLIVLSSIGRLATGTAFLVVPPTMDNGVGGEPEML